jgi:hypothetical protein
MDIRRIAVASVALLLSGWSLFEAGRSSRTLQRTEVRHRSAADELRRMQAQPEDALVLWIPGEFDDRGGLAPSELVLERTARSNRVGKSSFPGVAPDRLSGFSAQ